jgi:hypothetical protein
MSGLIAAFCAAVGIVVRQRAAQRVPTGPAGQSAELATTLVREPSWWAGILATVGGYVFQVLALAHGSLLLVQPLLVSSLPFALPLSAHVRRQRVSWAEWGWAALLTAVAVLLGMVAVLTKICTHRFAIGGWHAVLTIPAPYMLIALAVAVTVVQNAALHAGALQASVPIMLVGEPVVAVLLGMVVLGEHVGVRGPGAIVLVVAVWAMVTATVALARGQAGERADHTVLQRYSSHDSDARLAAAGSERLGS